MNGSVRGMSLNAIRRVDEIPLYFRLLIRDLKRLDHLEDQEIQQEIFFKYQFSLSLENVTEIITAPKEEVSRWKRDFIES